MDEVHELNQGNGYLTPQHHLKLSSIDKDSPGEQLTVVCGFEWKMCTGKFLQYYLTTFTVHTILAVLHVPAQGALGSCDSADGEVPTVTDSGAWSF